MKLTKKISPETWQNRRTFLSDQKLEPTAAIVAIGSEITSGEIVNSNASWISQQLDQLGIITKVHYAIPDNDDVIERYLQLASEEAVHVFVIGGLGPTSDDRTRSAISRWSRKPLVYNQDSWMKLEQIFNERGISIKPGHLHQCHFPQDFALLENQVGTAHGFFALLKKNWIWVLPGPPNELRPMLINSICPILKSLQINKVSQIRRWHCFGVPESDLADMTDTLVKEVGWLTGYRASFPYVTVKVWTPIELSPSEHQVFSDLDSRLSKYSVAKDEWAPLRKLTTWLSEPEIDVHICDQASGGEIFIRLRELAKIHSCDINWFKWTISNSPLECISEKPDGFLKKTCLVELKLVEEGWQVTFGYQDVRRTEILQPPFRVKSSISATRTFLTEQTLLRIEQWL